MFISSGLFPSALKQDKIIFKNLIKFCKKKDIKLTFCSRVGSAEHILKRNHKNLKIGCNEENFHRNYFDKGNWIYLPRINTLKTYTDLNKQQMVVFSHSTLGFQALSKGIRCAVFYRCYPEKGARGKFPKSGPFWINSNTYYSFEKVLNRVMNFSNKRWKKIAKEYSNKILSYNPSNIKKRKIINMALKL